MFCFCQAAKAALHLPLRSVRALSLPSKESGSGLQRVNKQQELRKELHLMWSQAACRDRTVQPVTDSFVLETYTTDWAVDETTARRFCLAAIWREKQARDKPAVAKCVRGWLENSRYMQLHFWEHLSHGASHFPNHHDNPSNKKVSYI